MDTLKTIYISEAVANRQESKIAVLFSLPFSRKCLSLPMMQRINFPDDIPPIIFQFLCKSFFVNKSLNEKVIYCVLVKSQRHQMLVILLFIFENIISYSLQHCSVKSTHRPIAVYIQLKRITNPNSSIINMALNFRIKKITSIRKSILTLLYF